MGSAIFENNGQFLINLLTLLGGVVFGNVTALRKDKMTDKHVLIEQLQEELLEERKERKYIQKQVDELYKQIRALEENHARSNNKVMQLEWNIEIRDQQIQDLKEIITEKNSIIRALKSEKAAANMQHNKDTKQINKNQKE